MYIVYIYGIESQVNIYPIRTVHYNYTHWSFPLFSSETRWDGQVIIVMNDVRISSPYKPENCTGKTSALVETIQKMVSWDIHVHVHGGL